MSKNESTGRFHHVKVEIASTTAIRCERKTAVTWCERDRLGALLPYVNETVNLVQGNEKGLGLCFIMEGEITTLPSAE